MEEETDWTKAELKDIIYIENYLKTLWFKLYHTNLKFL